ncbi:MAG TPA: tRNA (cytidine(34)-2'-O)-methyltransferase [Elusimicrobiota bacterium]|nr:tRNA (cytidine(34)-2'-O)-methyltransferase [Elusimicrobiota bacterium]
MLKVVLIQPEIPGNTGNVGRTCSAAGAELHLVKPLGFSLSERHLKRAGLDYWERLAPVVHESVDAFLKALPSDADVLAFSAEGKLSHWEAPYRENSWLVFGGESFGLPPELRALWKERLCRVPMVAGARSLNLSSAAAVVLYEALGPRSHARIGRLP